MGALLVDLEADGRMTEPWDYLERWGSGRWLRLPVIGFGVGEMGAIVSGIDWAHVWPMVGLAITAIGTACIGLYRYLRLTEIEIEERRRQMEARLGQVIVAAPGPLPPPKSDPELRP